jgi:hypothetical protein
VCVQGILDVGMTQEDHVELVKTHTFVRKHATGTAKIELHVLQVERGRKHGFLSLILVTIYLVAVLWIRIRSDGSENFSWIRIRKK